ncbi:hypothetical protein LTR70_009623 [Exophiala xenobiotica]|uniref:PNPLA domain-containing protein n=1 Tax=Lithohypha guttulata TaxID=1690604 RepID=A0ABR0KFB2_9EURO|nr:hypothetical protein LTR24_003223 [Lithohypha guttulata]KAK5310247.1 hypothetical protein LTR70_009623 [Exophiala xenobiotica]
MASTSTTSQDGSCGTSTRPDLCVLSLDGGGVHSLSSLYILSDVMQQVNSERKQLGKESVKPCQLFDLIGGTSTGGLIAVMLGRLEMSMDECIDAYLKICKHIFVKERRTFSLSGKVKARFDTNQLEILTKQMVAKHTGGKNSERMLDKGRANSRLCRVFVCASCTENVRLRSYHSEHQPTSAETMIWQAIRATFAATSLFEPITINNQTYACATTGANNTSMEVWEEAQHVWAAGENSVHSRIKCFVSIGAGELDLGSVEGGPWKIASRTLTRIANESRKATEDFRQVHNEMFVNDSAFRFDVDGLKGIGLEEHKKTAETVAATTKYLCSEISMNKEYCVSRLVEKQTSPSSQLLAPSNQPSIPNTTKNSDNPSSADTARSSSYACGQGQNIGHKYPQTNVADRGQLHQGDQHNHFYCYYPTDGSRSERRETQATSQPGSADRSSPTRARQSTSNAPLGESEGGTATHTPILLMPYEVNSRFINRPDELQALNSCFFSGHGLLGDKTRGRDIEQLLHRRAALYGLSGVGKTQLAISFAHRYRRIRPDHSIFWIHASTEEWLRQSFQKLADACEIEVATERQADVFTAVGAWLKNESTRPWLMILDNADDADMLFHTRRRLADAIAECPHGALLVTTRNKKVAEKITFYGETIQVKEMTQEQSVELMNSFLGVQVFPMTTHAQTYMSPAIKELVKHLEKLPLAVAQAAAYIKENSITVDVYLDMWKESAENAQELLISEFEADGRQRFDASVPNAVGTTMMLSLDHLRAQRPRTGHLLVVVSFFHHTSIRPFLLLEAGERQSSPAFIEAMGDLYAFSLMSKNAKDGVYEMHRLVHHVTCKWRTMKVSHSELEAAARFALDRLNKAFPTTMDKIDRQRADAYLPHALRYLREEDKVGTSIEARAKVKLMQKVAEHLLYQGRALESKSMRQEALALCESSSEVATADILRAKCELAEVLEQLHHFEQAKVNCQEIINRTLTLGKPSRAYINSLRMMARILTREGAHDHALRQAREAKNASSNYLGRNHEETLVLNFTIAEILQDHAEHCPEQKEKLLYQAKHTLQRAIEGLIKQKGPDASTTILGKQHLTNVLDALDQHEESETLSEEIIASKKRTLGDDGLETFQATMNLAFCFIKQTKLLEAEQLLAYALKTTSPAINNHHLGRAKGLQILASIHIERAEQWRSKLAERALLSSRAEGEAKSDVLPLIETCPGGTSKADPSANHKPALELEEVVTSPRPMAKDDDTSILEDLVKEDEKKSPHGLLPTTDVRSVAYERHALDEYQQGLKYQMEVADMLIAAPGIEHPDTVRHILDTSRTLLHLYRANSQAYYAEGDQAEEWQRMVLETQVDGLGEKHEDTLATKELLAATLHEKGKPEEAEPFAYAAFKDRVARLGKSHPETLIMQQMLAEIMNKQPSSRKRSLEVLHSCWQLSLKALGADDTDTRLRLALWRQWKKTIDESAKLFESTNSLFTTVASRSTSQILDANDGMTRLLTHNTLRFTVIASHKSGFLENIREKEMAVSPTYRSARVIRGFRTDPERANIMSPGAFGGSQIRC